MVRGGRGGPLGDMQPLPLLSPQGTFWLCPQPMGPSPPLWFLYQSLYFPTHLIQFIFLLPPWLLNYSLTLCLFLEPYCENHQIALSFSGVYSHERLGLPQPPVNKFGEG